MRLQNSPYLVARLIALDLDSDHRVAFQQGSAILFEVFRVPAARIDLRCSSPEKMDTEKCLMCVH